MADSRSIDLTIALPAYREAASLRTLLPALQAAAAGIPAKVEIIVVDSAVSLDDSEGVCRDAGVRHIRRRGGERYGDAMRTAIAEASGTWLLFMDADGSHPPTVVPLLWANRGSYTVVIGSRYVSGGQTDNSAILIGMSLFLNFAFRKAFSLDCKDVTNSLRLYDGATLRSLKLQSNDFDILQEILIKIAAMRPRKSIAEVPITFLQRTAGESKRKLIPFIIAYLRTMARLWRIRRA